LLRKAWKYKCEIEKQKKKNGKIKLVKVEMMLTSKNTRLMVENKEGEEFVEFV
jgi:hypothetical protein